MHEDLDSPGEKRLIKHHSEDGVSHVFYPIFSLSPSDFSVRWVGPLVIFITLTKTESGRGKNWLWWRCRIPANMESLLREWLSQRRTLCTAVFHESQGKDKRSHLLYWGSSMDFTPVFNSKPGKASQDLVCVLPFSPDWLKCEEGRGHSHFWSWWLLSFQACALKGLLGHFQKANAEEPACSKTLFLFFLTLIAQMLPVTGLHQLKHCRSKYRILRTGC